MLMDANLAEIGEPKGKPWCTQACGVRRPGQERFRNAVVRRLARLEARDRVLQLSKIVDWLPGGACG